MNNIFNTLQTTLHINIIIVVLVIASGFFQSKYLGFWQPVKSYPSYNSALRTLIAATFFCVVYVALDIATLKTVKSWGSEIFISYAIATSFYELLIKPVLMFMGLVQKSDPPKDIPTDQNNTASKN